MSDRRGPSRVHRRTFLKVGLKAAGTAAGAAALGFPAVLRAQVPPSRSGPFTRDRPPRRARQPAGSGADGGRRHQRGGTGSSRSTG